MAAACVAFYFFELLEAYLFTILFIHMLCSNVGVNLFRVIKKQRLIIYVLKFCRKIRFFPSYETVMQNTSGADTLSAILVYIIYKVEQ